MALAGDAGQPAIRLPLRRDARQRQARASATASTDLELASRLSFFLWGSGPDEELLKAAQAQTALARPVVSRSR